MNRLAAILLGTLLAACPAWAQQDKAPAKPKPDLADVKYGPHERNVLDLWKVKADAPTPLVVFIHGGGFRGGDKGNLPAPLLERCLKEGVSVASINYRLSQHAPFPAPMLDSARALQFIRSNAKEWNLDPKRVAASGGSAGAGISLWLGYHDDLADPKSDDPIARQSTRLSCMGVVGAQSSYDPRFIQKEIGGRAHEHPALLPFYGLKADEIDTPKAYKLYEEASPINYVSADDPPAFLFYTEANTPLPADAKPGQGIHHPRFGEVLKAKLDPLKVECVLRHMDDYKGKANANDAMYGDMVAFFLGHFAPKKPDAKPGPAKLSLGRPGEVITPAAKGERLSDRLKVGDLAPDFTLPDPKGTREVTLTDFRDKRPVVLVFGSYT